MSEGILLTGGTGFIGNAVALRLADRHSGLLRLALRGPAASLPAGADAVVVGDFTATTDWAAALRGINCVVHLAARVHVGRDDAADAWPEYRKVNVDATLSLATQAAAIGVKRLIFLSSAKVNDGTFSPDAVYTENDPSPAPRDIPDAYSRSKLEAEQGLLAIASRTGLEIVVIRPPLVYGPGAKANFATLIRAIRLGVPLPFGSVRNKRSFVGLDNLVDFILTCISHPSAGNELFFVSDGEDLATPDLVRRLGIALGRPARLIPFPPKLLVALSASIGRKDLALRLLGSLRVDNRKARAILGWTPPVGVDEGLRRAVAPLRTRGA